MQQEVLFGVPETDVDNFAEEPPPPPTERLVPKIITGKSTPSPNVGTSINKLTDKQVLRDLMSGDYCLQGVGHGVCVCVCVYVYAYGCGCVFLDLITHTHTHTLQTLLLFIYHSLHQL